MMGRLLNAAVFLLTGYRRALLILAVSTVLAWWFASDYYFAEWPSGMDAFVFIGFSVSAFIVMLLFFRAAIRGHHRGGRIVALVDPAYCGPELVVSTWREALWQRSHIGRPTLWTNYLMWHHKRLEGLADDVPISPEQVQFAWRTKWSSASVWPRVLWLPALWTILFWLPRHSTVVEQAAVMTGNPPRILSIECIGRDPRTRAPIRERLRFENGVFTRAGKCAFLSSGVFRVFSTAFPRMYHTLSVSCAELCSLPSVSNAKPRLEETYDVRAGVNSFDWLQTTPEPKLAMIVSLLGPTGTEMDSVKIDP